MIDHIWLSQQLTRQGLSQSGLGRAMGFPPERISRLLRGERKITLQDAAQIAKILGCSLEETAIHLGTVVATLAPPTPQEREVSWQVNRQGDITSWLGPRRKKVIWLDATVQAIAMVDRASPLYGWVFFFSPCQTIPPRAIGRFCVVQITPDTRLLRRLMPGFTLDHYNLLALSEECQEEDVRVLTSSPLCGALA